MIMLEGVVCGAAEVYYIRERRFCFSPIYINVVAKNNSNTDLAKTEAQNSLIHEQIAILGKYEV